MEAGAFAQSKQSAGRQKAQESRARKSFGGGPAPSMSDLDAR
jgi:hypothetical protein